MSSKACVHIASAGSRCSFGRRAVPTDIDIDDALFRPRGIAIIGASNDPAKLSGRPLDYLLRMGYKGQVYPVNPTRPAVQGVKSYVSLRDVPGPVDLAIVVVPSSSVVQALNDCAEARVSAAIVFASGFSEMGGKGRDLQEQVEHIAKTTGLRIVGPNCLGTFCLPTSAFATFSSAFDEEGELPDDSIAVVSQSGAVGTFIYSTMVSQGVGARYYANTGNQADVTVAELLARLARADDVDVLIGYLEDGRSLDKLEEAAATAQQRGKPMILLKSGATDAGARAVGFHTSSAPGTDAAFQEIADRYGAIRVEGMEAAADSALMFRTGRRSTGRRIAIITSSGGAAALATDAAVQIGLRVDEPSAESKAALKALLPEFGSAANPIDLTGALLNDPPLLERVMSKVVADPDIDMILVVLGNADRGSEGIVEGIRSGFAATKKPFAVAWSGGSGRPRRTLLGLGIPTYSDPLRAVRALLRVANFSANATESSGAAPGRA
ncbi:CoA-binding protein [Burkholderia territorii]|uniref:CoA-binding protein n=1 Tax=Burkholderia territorii TaxID=1503055 RepID=UPI0009BE5703|nr:CoA-binding protein [Burkholderia territorii]